MILSTLAIYQAQEYSFKQLCMAEPGMPKKCENVNHLSDSDEDAVVTSERSADKKKKSNKDERLKKFVNELKDLHEQQFTPMQYRI